MKINGIEVEVLAQGIEKYGRTWDEIDEYPTIQRFRTDGVIESEDWEVISNDDMTLYMNNMDGYIVLIEKEKEHWEEGKGFVIDRRGHIYFSFI